MWLGSRSDLFRMEFPKVFIPEDVKAKWAPYVRRMPTPTENISDIINYSIQGVTVPNFNYEPVEQVKPGNAERARGTTRKWRGSMSQEMLVDRKLEVSFKMLDGYFNYWVLMDTFFAHYAFENTKPFTVDLPLRILDQEGTVMYTMVFHDVLYTGLDRFELSYSAVSQDHRTFNCSFEFNEVAVTFELG